MKSLASALAISLLLVSSVLAQGRPVGVRVTVNSVDAISGEVDFDITLNTNEVYGVPTLTSPTGLLGDYLFTEFYATTYPPGYTGQLLSPVVAAVDYGDGSTLPNARIPQVGPGTYRGNFVHTYPGAGTYDLRVAAAAMLDLGATVDERGVGKQGAAGASEGLDLQAARGAATVTTGNLIYNPNQAPTTPTGAQSFLGSWFGRSFFGSALTYNLVGPLDEPFAWGISNSVTSQAPFGGPDGGVLIEDDVLAIPTLSPAASALLAVLFAGLGLAVLALRR